ncbi:hypothetical protein BTN50_0540 [Candidatus Enterovibrio altilux]|uniref:Uncharacterized protein n=1 Tax=Candidatus Enterovibrio altilux TaxID=1927128 RepID=A0A291B7W8_9GAMM|nr:hypothetical protein BTN50_0540 [Candidatus Enterovibrio luxaltus]
MVKRVFSRPLRDLQGFINSVFQLAQLPYHEISLANLNVMISST